MRASKTLISSAAAAAIVSLVGLAYAQSTDSATLPTTGDTVQMQQQTRDDTSTAPTGTLQSVEAPTAPAVSDPGSNPVSAPLDNSAATTAPSADPSTINDPGMNRSNDNGVYNAGSNAVAPSGSDAPQAGAAPEDNGMATAERPPKADRK